MASRGRIIHLNGTGGDQTNGKNLNDNDDDASSKASSDDGSIYKNKVRSLSTVRTLAEYRAYKGGGAFKALDEVIEERRICKPSKFKTRQDHDFRDFSLTGRNSRDQSERTYSGSKLNPRTSSLDAIIGGCPNNEDAATASFYRSKKRWDDAADGGFKMQSRNLQNDVTSFSIAKKGKLDPRSCSLDDIIGDRCSFEDGPREAKQRRTEARTDFDDGDFTLKTVLTPYQAVLFLQEMGMIIDFKIGNKVADDKGFEDSNHKWRFVVKCGTIQGVADSASKPVARELACDSFLKNLRNMYPNGKIPHYEISDELFLDPKIFSEIEEKCKEAEISISYKFMDCGMTGESQGAQTEYTCVYSFGDKEIEGTCTKKEYARLKAAYSVYESLQWDAFRKISYFTDKECDLNVEYNFTKVLPDETVDDMDSPEQLKRVFAKLRKEILEESEASKSVRQRPLIQW